MKNPPKELQAFRKEIEQKSGIFVESKGDFEKLHKWINHKTEEIQKLYPKDKKEKSIITDKVPSAETLMRIWEYVAYDGKILNKTWAILARSIGYKSWGDYKERNADYTPPIPSIEEIFEQQRVDIYKHSNADGIYMLGWYPAKYSKIKHVDAFEYEVIESKNMHKKQGDKFVTPDFSLSPELDNSEFPDIMLDDDGEYFSEEERENKEYFYL